MSIVPMDRVDLEGLPSWPWMLGFSSATVVFGTLLYLALRDPGLLLGMLVALSVAWGMRLAQATYGGDRP